MVELIIKVIAELKVLPIAIVICGLCIGKGVAMSDDVKWNAYKGELITYPGPWAFEIGKSAVILVSDLELQTMASNPDAILNLSLTYEPLNTTLRQVCARAQAAGQRTLIIAFDHFFSQYRPGQTGPRRWTPDMDEYVQRIKKISDFAGKFRLGLELSILSPLEIGPAYRRATGESGEWMHYRKGLRDPKTGRFSVQLWQQKRWANNKGIVELEDAGVRVFAFKEQVIPGTPYRVVAPESIVEITDVAKVEQWDGMVARGASDYRAQRIRVYGEGRTEIGDLDRVLVVQQYRTPEMDYFSTKALPFLKALIDKYAEAGVKLHGLYADEMHIQQDWDYFNHHENGEFAMRYVSPGLAKEYAKRFGSEYEDFAKYLVYFVYGQEDFSNNVMAKQRAMCVFGSSPEDIRRTALFRARYYHLLQDGVVDLFAQAKRYAEQRMGYKLEARAHATWAESPTIDKWDTGQLPMFPSAYEYTSNFVWSNTVHQSAAACSDYFKWGDFLTGNGNDHAEGGYADRNYYALALACSTGILNEVPYSYAAHWGMPSEISRRRSQLESAFGTGGSPLFGLVEEMEHRDVDVLMLYPIDLVAVEERFGSWMTQYGYANYVTASKLLEAGRLDGPAIRLGGRRFSTLVVTFEPFPSARVLNVMKQFVEAGGRLVWSGPPPVLTQEGDDALSVWQGIFGVEYTPGQSEGIAAPGRKVMFEGRLKDVQPQTILTDFLVDRVYPVKPNEHTSVVARIKDMTVGTLRQVGDTGLAVFLGYRPRDDQSASLGYETRNWFEVLCAIGAYAPTGRFSDVNDNTEYISRTSPYLTCRFPNGAVSIAPHFKEMEETWPGGFARKQDEDKAYMERHPLPPNDLKLKDFRVNGHSITFNGQGAMAFRVSEAGDLIAFAGSQCAKIVVDGRDFIFSDQEQPVHQIAWAPVPEGRRVPGGAVMQIMVYGTAKVRIPVTGVSSDVELVVEGSKPGSRGAVIPSRLQNGVLFFEVTDQTSGRWMYVVNKESPSK